MKKVFKLKALVTASDNFSDHRTATYYLTTDYETYDQAKDAIPGALTSLEERWNPERFSNRANGFYLSIHEFYKSDFCTTYYTDKDGNKIYGIQKEI